VTAAEHAALLWSSGTIPIIGHKPGAEQWDRPPGCELVAEGSLKVFALLVEVVEVGCGRTGIARLLHFDAARVGPLAAAALR